MAALRGVFQFWLVAVVPQLVSCLVASPMSMQTMVRPSAGLKMQYGQGYAQPGYGAQQQSQALWRIYPFSGVQGHNRFSGAVSPVNQGRFGSVCEKYGQLPYTLIANDERILSLWNMVNMPSMNQKGTPAVSRSQCKVSLYPDGTAVLTSQGSCSPTLVRSPGGQWTPIYKDQTYMLQNGDQVSLDANYPESAVFTCANEGVGQQGGGYGQQQQGGYGYGQQGGYGY